LTPGGNLGDTIPPNDPRMNERNRVRTRDQQGTLSPGVPAVPVPQRGATPAPNQQRQPATGTRTVPQSRNDILQQSESIPRTVLAQVADPAAESAPANASPDAVPSGQPEAAPSQPATSSTSTTGEIDPLSAGPTTPSRTDPRQIPNTTADGGTRAAAGAGVGPTISIGTLTVDQSGTGRFQQVVEAVRVQDVVGQAIVIYSQKATPQATLPPNLDATADPLAGSDVRRAPAGGSGQGPAQAGPSAGEIAAKTQPGTSNTAPPNAGTGGTPIAGGVIRLMTDGAPAGTTRTNQPLPSPQSPNGSREVPQSSAVPPAAEQPQVR
jgi:hypothetical protein